MLSFVDRTNASYQAAMQDAEALKRRIDGLAKCYAVAVKGQAFPAVTESGGGKDRMTVIAASSWAMANCFEIERSLRRSRAAWYLDGRIVAKLAGTSTGKGHRVKLLPTRRMRKVFTYSGYLWP